MAEIAPFFAVPFAFARLENAATLHAQLRELFLARAGEGPRYANPKPLTQRNAQTFESNFQFFRWPEACVQRLKEFCWQHVLQVVCELNGYDAAVLKKLLLFSDSWFHVTRRGGYFALHNHPMASWSGVYCVDPGRHDADKPDSGVLSFANPAVTSAMFLDAATANLQGPYAYSIRHLHMQAGQLVIFPSWVLHDVKPFEGEGERITVAFNCWFQLQNAGAN